MLLRIIVIAIVSAVSLAAPKAVRFGCRSEHPPAALIAVAKGMKTQEAHSRNSARVTPIQVDLYFHVVAASSSEADGNVPDNKLQRQIIVLNNAFRSHSIQFTYKNTSRTINPHWSDDEDELSMKRALRKGSYSALNVYFVRSSGGNFGHCYFPGNILPGSASFIKDGCTVLAGTVPGGSIPDYNLGHTATHEVGHWFGLFHTFQGDSCDGSGDNIDDTPQQSVATDGCPRVSDSCPKKSGVDSIHNFMDYSTDACYRDFTAGQSARMHNMWNEYRKHVR